MQVYRFAYQVKCNQARKLNNKDDRNGVFSSENPGREAYGIHPGNLEVDRILWNLDRVPTISRQSRGRIRWHPRR